MRRRTSIRGGWGRCGALLLAGTLLVGVGCGRDENVDASGTPPAAASEPERRIAAPAREEAREKRRERFQRIRDRLGELRERRRLFDGAGETAEAEEPLAPLADSGAKARAQAIALLRNDSAYLPQVISALNTDPDPRVRVAAADWLGDNASYGAVNALIGALEDPSAEVTLKVLEALEDAGDESVIVYLQPLLDSPDPEVREAAGRAIEFLE